MSVHQTTMENTISHSSYMDEVCPGIFLGNIIAVNTDEGRKILTQNAVTHILSIQSMRPNIGSLDIKHKFVCVNDMPDVDILHHFQECISFINEALSDGKVLVHCLMGVSRSSTIVIAYLMHRDKITLKEALKKVQQQHPAAEPNCGFMDMLRLFEAMGCEFSSLDPLYKQHKLGQIAQEVEAGGRLPEDMIAVDPQESTSNQTETVFKCRKCRRAVFLESSVLAHITGKGQTSFNWHKQAHSHSQGVNTPPSDGMDSSGTSCTSLFVEPVKWMEPLMIGKLEGKLPCPKCNARLGSFRWDGTQCSCGAWVTPSFQIHQNRLDRTIQKQPVKTTDTETS